MIAKKRVVPVDPEPQVDDEFTMAQFFSELNKYPKVRNASFQVHEGEEVEEKASVPPALLNNSAKKQIRDPLDDDLLDEALSELDVQDPLTEKELGPTGSFWYEFYEFLKKYYSRSDAANFWRMFKSQHQEYLRTISPTDAPKLLTQYQTLLQNQKEKK